MSFRNRHSLISILAFSVFLFCFTTAVFGQTEPDKPISKSANQITANENFELNITQDRITEANFARSTKVELTDSNRGGLRVEVGVGVRAEKIDVNLRGIFGSVRFRASLESLRQRIENLQTTVPNSIAPLR